MRRKLFLLFSLAAGFCLVHADEKFPVHEGWSALRVKTTAPIPSEVSNVTQARALSREAAVVMGQDALLTYVLKKKTHSKKTLAVAEVPSLELQQKIRATIKGVRVIRTQWINNECRVTLELPKRHIKAILRNN